MDNAIFSGLVLILAGLLGLLGGALNWHIVTNSGKLFNRLLGDTAARVIYALVGTVLIILGIGQLVGIDWF